MDKDEYPRAGTTVEKLAGLKAAFKNDGTVTAGNASGINDGAAALVVASNERVSKTGEPVLARVLSYASTGIDPAIMGMGPVEATRKALARAGLTTASIDLFELNEAFASQALAVARELDLDTSKVNVRGGAIALASGLLAAAAGLQLGRHAVKLIQVDAELVEASIAVFMTGRVEPAGRCPFAGDCGNGQNSGNKT